MNPSPYFGLRTWCDLSMATLQHQLMLHPPNKAVCSPVPPIRQISVCHKAFPHDIPSTQNTLLLAFHMAGPFSSCSSLLKSLCSERGLLGHPDWPAWLYLAFYQLSCMWYSFTDLMVYCSDFCLGVFLVHHPPRIIKRNPFLSCRSLNTQYQSSIWHMMVSQQMHTEWTNESLKYLLM